MDAERAIGKLLVANRGEIARRVFATCRRMGIATAAVYSEPDSAAPFVAEADESVPLGGVTAAESYLRADAVLAAAQALGADAVHPGYGFLAENAEFARAVEAAGLIWVGPPAEAIESMGSKVRARAMMEQAGVPILPGAELTDGAVAAVEAELVGYPLLVKASAGGGGRGMRSVSGRDEIASAVEGASREAEAAFGDGTVFLERFLERPRHVEIQVFADRHGNTVSLGERECSIQRRHQKVVEESPSPAVDAALRGRMGAAAIAAAEAVSYVGAGTVEFLLGPDGEFYFLEMNTRLQVEHPVTELVTGLDLVRLQLLVAAGGELPREARLELDAEPARHAIEARLYAEDPAAAFLPQTGTVCRLELPNAGRFELPGPQTADAGVRLDSGVEAGSVVSPHYDPMLAKVIAWAPSRREAAALLAAELAAGEIHGLTTNRDFLVRVLRHPAFAAADTDTGFLERHDGLAEPLADPASERLHAAAAVLAETAAPEPGSPLGFAAPGWRNNPSQPQTVSFAAGATATDFGIAYRFGREGLEVGLDGDPLEAAVLHGIERDGPLAVVDLEIDSARRRYRVHRDGELRFVNSPLGQSTLRELPRFASDSGEQAEGALVAPMPGKVIRLIVAEQQSVQAGEVIAVLEAMKMEHELTAGSAGSITELRVAEGDQVEAGAVIAVIDAE